MANVTKFYANKLGTAGRIIVPAGLSLIAFFSLRSMARGAAKRNEEKKIGTSRPTQLAAGFVRVLQKEKWGFLKSLVPAVAVLNLIKTSFSGSDENSVQSLAREVDPTEWDDVQKSYRKLTKGDSLLDDIRKKLDGEEYQDFLKNLSKASEAAQQQAQLTAQQAQQYAATWAAVVQRFHSEIQKNLAPGKYWTFSPDHVPPVTVKAAKRLVLRKTPDKQARAYRRLEKGALIGKITLKVANNDRISWMEIQDPSGQKVWADVRELAFYSY